MTRDISSKKQPNARIGLFLLYNSLESLHFVRDALSMLVEAGYTVDVYSAAAPAPGEATQEGVSMLGHPEAFQFFMEVPGWVKRLRHGGRPYGWLVMNLYRPLMRRLSLNRFLRRRHSDLPYICFIGNDPEGLVSAAPLAKMLGVPLIFWSFELVFADEIQGMSLKRLKEKEVEACRDIPFAIIQDPWRGRALAEENGIPSDKMVYVPNAPRGVARRRKSDYLYRRLNIDPKRKIILYAGMFDRGTMSAELVAAAAGWPEEYVLVMQSHWQREMYWDQAYLDEVIRLADPARVILSFEPVPSMNYRDMMDSADAGLVFYLPYTSTNYRQGRNVYLMGFSSGKLSGFLHSGLPVVVNDAVIGPRQLVEEWNCGLCVSDPQEIGLALEKTFLHYDEYSSNAIRCFDQELEIGARFERVIERLDGMSSSQTRNSA